MKTFSDHCLEYADKSTKGPWKGDEFEMTAPKADTFFPGNVCLVWSEDHHMNECDADFIKKARTDLPELAKRLQKAIAIIRNQAILWKLEDAIQNCICLNQLADTLERMPE